MGNLSPMVADNMPAGRRHSIDVYEFTNVPDEIGHQELIKLANSTALRGGFVFDYKQLKPGAVVRSSDQCQT